jgi:hypothetical protein
MRTATFALFIGVIYLSAGLLGLIPEALQPPPADAPPTHFTMRYGYLLGLFPVNVLHSVVHLAVGAFGIIASREIFSTPRIFARALAVFYGALAVLGLIPGMDTLFGLLPIHGHDVWLHGGTAVVAAYFGWRTEVSIERRATPAPDRREQLAPVAKERRYGHGDRRLPTSEV